MIEFIKAPKTSDGKTHADLTLAQEHELRIIADYKESDPSSAVVASVIAVLVAQKEKVVDVLSTNEKSRPPARKINGGKKRKAVVPEANRP